VRTSARTVAASRRGSKGRRDPGEARVEAAVPPRLGEHDLRASNTGVIMVAGHKIALGCEHQHDTVTVHVSETTITLELPCADELTVRRTTTQPVRSIQRTVATVR
jgi:hypothetical protein